MEPAKYILNHRQRCDLELLLTGAFAPLNGFLDRAEYESVLHHMRLTNGALCPIPVTLDVPEETAAHLAVASTILLCKQDGTPLARLLISDVYRPDLLAEAAAVYGTTDSHHVGVQLLLNRNPIYVGGRVESLINDTLTGIYRLTDFPADYIPLSVLKQQLSSVSGPIVAFHTRNPMHFAHIALTLQALQDTGGHLLLHPTVGPAMPDDIDPYVRLAAYRAILPYYPRDANDQPRVTLAAVPLAMRMAGPREALWHALIRKNFGASYFIVGRAHADPGDHPSNPNGFFYEPFAAQDLVQKYAAEIGISVLAYPAYGHNELEGKCTPTELGGKKQLSGTEIRRRLAEGEQIPEWFSPPEVVGILRSAYRGPKGRGLVIFLTGLPAAGKSTIAGILANCLRAVDDRPVTLLDGDIIRTFLSKGLGYSREDRMENIRRIGFVASLVARHGGIAITAAIAPYADARREARYLVEQQGGAFFEVYVSTPLEECERRDPKGLYRAARRGELKHLTGIDDPYEPPINADLEVTQFCNPIDTIQRLFHHLYESKLISVSDPPRPLECFQARLGRAPSGLP